MFPDTPHRHNPAVRFALEEANAETGTFKGMASVFGTLVDDYYHTRIMPGAFARTLREDLARVRILYQHDTWQPVGKPTTLEETSQGLYIEGEIVDTAVGVDAMKLMRRGIIDELSIGFDPVRWEMVRDGTDEERHIYELTLWEVSLVTFGANRDAKIMSVHAMVGELPSDVQAIVRPIMACLLARPAGTTMPAPVSLLAQALAIHELHEGKTLSTKNKTLVKNAVAALKALLDAAGGDEDAAAGLAGDCYGAATLDLLALEHDLALCQ